MSDLERRAAGCLLGLACGDALGGTVEFMPRQEVASRYPDGLRDIVGGGPHRLEPGEYTDDTAMALAISRACTADGIDLDAVAAGFVDWYRSGPKDIGNATANALRLLDRGVPWQDAGEQLQAASRDGVAGNGTVMRCAPIAIRFLTDPKRLRKASIETSRMTHADPRATWGAVALNQAIAWLLEGGEIAGAQAAAVADVDDMRVVAALGAVPHISRDDICSGGYVLDTLQAAFWCLERSESAEEAIVQAVMLGDDADTTGAVAGALAGAAYGVDRLPDRWLAVLHDRDEIRELALQLAGWSTPR